MPVGVWYPGAVAVINGEIWVAGGQPTTSGTPAADTQVYSPATNTRSAGVSLPTPLDGGGSAVVKDVWYVMGGTTNGSTYTNVTWAYNLRTKTWSAKAPLPTAVHDPGVAVYEDLIYVIGGNSETMLRSNTVQIYNPATDTWTEAAPLLAGKSEPSVALFGTIIVAADGITGSIPNGDNEGYEVTRNTWTVLAYDPTPRNGACSGRIGQPLYVAGGDDTHGQALSVNELFELSTNRWTTPLAPMPQATMDPGSAV